MNILHKMGTIVIVDDTPDNLRLLTQLLNEHGYKTRPIPGGERALSAIQKALPDLILLDIMMPGMNGYEVCEKLKADEHTRDIPIIFLSALNEAIDKVKAFSMGGVDYVTKPFQAEEVLARVKTHLTLQKIQYQLQEQNTQLQQEIRQRKKTEEILYQSRALLASVLNSSLDGIMAFQSVRDGQGKIVDFQWLVANPVAAKDMGLASDYLIGKHLLEYLPRLQEEGLLDAYISVVETGETLDRELYYGHESARGCFHIVAVKLGDGLAVTFRNITKRKHMELELARQANLDGLTQIANRRCFDDQFSKEWRRCLREHKPLSIIICDVDYFKRYNDTYGHQMGDECLSKIATALSRVAKRPGDLAARYGGEEFIAILPYTEDNGALSVAKELREEIRQLQIPHESSDVNSYVTLSIGVASTVPIQQNTPKALLVDADKALYTAKQTGRNCIEVHEKPREISNC